MDKYTLENILSSAYNITNWYTVLTAIFGAQGLHKTPVPIQVSDGNLASGAFELGSFTTADDQLIGVYQITVLPNIAIERNKVGLRALLRNIYKYDVDGALIVFVQNKQWRLSFVSEIRTFDKGLPVAQNTDSKRYTYLLGEDTKVKTPCDRLFTLLGKTVDLNSLLATFSIEALNAQFYQLVAHQFYQLVGATTGKGNKQEVHTRSLTLPSVASDNHIVYQEFAVRLIGRMVFCWFLKEKKSEAGIALLPHSLLSSVAVSGNKNYYHKVLEPIFFQCLNTPMDQRIAGLPSGCELIPFLNGGLFDAQPDDHYVFAPAINQSQNINSLQIPDSWFFDFFTELEKYNFTIDENSTVDVELSVDPEMLGRIFENLLAEIDPDSGETARKATGSFYTPREIVDYMTTESLCYYLNNKTGIDRDRFKPLFLMDQKNDFDSTEQVKILEALDQLTTLDPACGSGAFPMGMLQKTVMALQQLDSKCKWWKKRQIDRIENSLLKMQFSTKLNSSSMEYARKIGVIQNSLYGVDIQAIAAEITKLRCFLTLVVDENIDDSKANRGVEPLPNLEFKFITADSLQKLPTENKQTNNYDLFNVENPDLDELQVLRLAYMQSFGTDKKEIKANFEAVQKRILAQQISSGGAIDTNSRAYKAAQWKPFTSEKANWFDPLWMFGLHKGFDVVIGNPPYVQLQKDGGKLAKQFERLKFETFERTGDIYSLFYERGVHLLAPDGMLCYITSNKWMRTNYGASTRQFFAEKTVPLLLIDFSSVQVFQTATVDTNILLLQNKISTSKSVAKTVQKPLFAARVDLSFNVKKDNLSDYVKANGYVMSSLNHNSWVVGNKDVYNIKEFIEQQGVPLKDWDIQINRGVLTGYNEAFIIPGVVRAQLIQEDPRSEEIIKPILRGRDIAAWYPKYADLWLINSHNGVKSLNIERINVKKDYPAIYNWLCRSKEILKKRSDKGDDWTNLRNCAYVNDFEKPKIMYRDITQHFDFSYISEPTYSNNTVYMMNGASLMYLTCIFNSSLFKYCFSDNFTDLGSKGRRLFSVFFNKIPIKQISKEQEIPYNKLVDYLVALKKEEANFTKNDRFMLVYFTQIADALVYELYFKEIFEERNIYIAKHLWEVPVLNDSEDRLIQLRKIFIVLNQHEGPLAQSIFNMYTMQQIQLIHKTVNR